MQEPRLRIINETGISSEAEPKKHFEILPTLQDIDPIEEGGLIPVTSNDLEAIVERPLLEACKIFFEKGIRTIMSSANKKDIESGNVHIIIDFDSLSPENRKIAQRYGVPYTNRENTHLKIVMYVTRYTTVKRISEHMTKIASVFEYQN